MSAFAFLVRRPDGSEREETFYAPQLELAAKYAAAWCLRMGFKLLESGEAS